MLAPSWLTVIVKSFVALRQPSLEVTVTVTVCVPVKLGVPEITCVEVLYDKPSVLSAGENVTASDAVTPMFSMALPEHTVG